MNYMNQMNTRRTSTTIQAAKEDVTRLEHKIRKGRDRERRCVFREMWPCVQEVDCWTGGQFTYEMSDRSSFSRRERVRRPGRNGRSRHATLRWQATVTASTSANTRASSMYEVWCLEILRQESMRAGPVKFATPIYARLHGEVESVGNHIQRLFAYRFQVLPFICAFRPAPIPFTFGFSLRICLASLSPPHLQP